MAIQPDDPSFLLTLVRILIAESRFPEAESNLDRAEQLLRRRGQPGEPAWDDVRELRERLRQERSVSVR